MWTFLSNQKMIVFLIDSDHLTTNYGHKIVSNYIFVSPLFVSTSACYLCTAKPVDLGG